MKTIIRVLIILAVFSALAGLMVLAVSASGANAPDFGNTLPQIRPGGDTGFNPGNEFRPEGNQNRPERGERGGFGGPRWLSGLVKNVGVIAVLVVLIVWPRNVAKKKKKQAAVSAANDQV
jgi:hypothetical protein